jgi:hypothetical protein
VNSLRSRRDFRSEVGIPRRSSELQTLGVQIEIDNVIVPPRQSEKLDDCFANIA